MIAILLLLSASTSLAAEVVFLNDTFSDNERSIQSLPTSATWTVGAHRTSVAYGTLNASAGNLVLDHTAPGAERSFAATWAHFAPSGSPITLNVGETLTLAFNITFVGGTFAGNTGAFRWALMDSGGSRVTTDFVGNNSPGISSGSTFSNWDGYESQTSVDGGAPGGNLLTRKRTGTGNPLFDSAQWTALGGTTVNEPQFVLGATYHGELIVTRTATGTAVLANIDGKWTNVAFDNSASAVFSFDTVAFFTTDAAGHDLVFDNVKVYIPEPASLSLLSVAALGRLARRRRSV